jgi:hypothetical protein
VVICQASLHAVPIYVAVCRSEGMRVAINAVLSTMRPLESSLLHRRNFQITFELFTVRMNFLITSHIDVDCQVVTRAGRLIILIILSFEVFLCDSRVSMGYNTIYRCKPIFDLRSCPMILKIYLSIARRRISCKPLLQSLQLFLPRANLKHRKRPGSRNGQRERTLVLMRIAPKYTSNSAVCDIISPM